MMSDSSFLFLTATAEGVQAPPFYPAHFEADSFLKAAQQLTVKEVECSYQMIDGNETDV